MAAEVSPSGTVGILAPLSIDADAIASLRDILIDPNAALYPDMTILRALRDNRVSVVYRDPVYSSFSVYPYIAVARAREKIPVTTSDPWNTQMYPEGDDATWAVKPAVRHWDSQSPVRVWLNGVEQTAALYGLSAVPFVVDYPSGRVQFNNTPPLPVHDYSAVSATFTCYKVYQAARQILLGSLGSTAMVGIKLSDVDLKLSIRDAIAALDTLIADMQPPSIPFMRRLY